MNEVVGVVQATHLVCVRVIITMYEYRHKLFYSSYLTHVEKAMSSGYFVCRCSTPRHLHGPTVSVELISTPRTQPQRQHDTHTQQILARHR